MSKKQFFAIIDTETTIDDTVADLGIVICDRKGVVHNHCAILIKGHFDEKELFFDPTAKGLWSKQYAREKRVKYNMMLNTGTRMLATPAAVNNWIAKAVGKYNPVLTAYNLPFDVSKCGNTGIDLSGFPDKFCLWAASVGNICKSKAYKQFALENHRFNKPTEFGNMTFKTDAETVAGFLAGEITDEPHTAYEDAVHFELPILVNILKKRNWKDKSIAYNWREFQVKDHFIAR